jgi:hypothetical protein
MRLEFLPDSPSGPILLLHGDAEDATVLFQAFEELALGVRDSIALHELPTIESPERCHVVASAVSGAEGLQSVSEQDIVWRLPRSGWQKVATLVAPFTSLPDASRAGSQRLYDDGTASVILSTTRGAPRERPDPRPGMQGRSRDKSKW